MSLSFYYLLGLIISFGLLVTVMPSFIDSLKKHNVNQEVSQYALEEFKAKDKTPIMGGLLFVVLPFIGFLVADYTGLVNKKLLFVLLSYMLFCLVGFLDDYVIIIKKNNDGISPITKLIMEFVFTLILYFVFKDVIHSYIAIPFTDLKVDLGFLYIPFMILLFLAEANAANFTDGMDGLCSGVSAIGVIALIVLCHINKEYDIAILLFCVLGGLLGYLRFNYHPAKIFMGDSGSLALGSLFASVAVVLDKEIALLFIGGIFVIEMFCVVVQQVCVRLFHKRVFSYTPIHYAFVIKGYKETQIVPLFYILATLFSIIGLIIGLH